MRRYLLTLVAIVLTATTLSAQRACFWTDDDSALPIKIYIDKTYMGEITGAYDSAPQFGDPGTVSVNLTYQKHDVAAVNCYGEVYEGFPSGNLRPRIDKDNYIRLNANRFKRVAFDAPAVAYMFYGWTPLPYVPHGHYYNAPGWRRRPVLDSDDEILIEMAVAAVTGTAIMATSAIRNWNYPDYRFPGVQVGYSMQYLSGINGLRNVAKGKIRFGNYGGLSLSADAGMMSEWYIDQDGWNRRYDSFTTSFGVGFDYSGFEFGFRYMPAMETYGATALLCEMGYDFFLTKKLVLNVGTGFGVSGWGSLEDNFEFPLTIGISHKF